MSPRTNQNPYTFAGTGIQDRTTGYIHYANRYYNPKTGTWTQQDTLDEPLDPMNANRYAYAAGDPVNNIDPTGRGFLGCLGTYLGIVGATVAFTTGVETAGVGAVVGYGLVLIGGQLILIEECT